MIRLDIRTKVAILLTVSICTFIINTIWIEAIFMVSIGGLQLASGKKVFCKTLVFVYLVFLFTGCVILPLIPGAVSETL